MKKTYQNILISLNRKYHITDEAIAILCGVRYITAYRWRRGMHRIPFAAGKLIEELYHKKLKS